MNVILFAAFILQLNIAFSFIPKFWKNNVKVSSSRSLQMATPAPTNKDSPMSGFFTNSSPDTKRVVPIKMEGKTRFKIVYVVLESQYQSALTKACNSINDGKEGVAVEAVGYLLEELRNPAVFEQFKEDVADANIFIGSLIFIQELADKVRLSKQVHSHLISHDFLSLLGG